MEFYGKLVDGALQPAPREFIEDGKRIIGFTDAFLRERGYKPVTYGAYPQDDGEYQPSYTETDAEILQNWIAVESQEPVTN